MQVSRAIPCVRVSLGKSAYNKEGVGRGAWACGGLGAPRSTQTLAIPYFLRFCCICLSYSRCSLPPDIRFSKKPSTRA